MLTEADIERLALLAEEASEVVQVTNKILRFGWDGTTERWPGEVIKNRDLLERELGDFMNALGLMIQEEDIDIHQVEEYAYDKLERLQHFLKHNEVREEE